MNGTMKHPPKTPSLETSLFRTLLLQRLGLGVVVAVIALAAAWAGIRMWKTTRPTSSTLPSYEHLDPASADYWVDRTLWNIESARKADLSENARKEQLRILANNDLVLARQREVQYDQLQAISDIAMTLARNDIDVNIDDTLRGIDDAGYAGAVRARIFVSQALMHLRLNNRSAARVAVMEYNRILVASDLKLESSINDLAFCGAVTVYACMEDTTALGDLFQKNLAYTPRAVQGQQMKAYRIIAGEQARVGFGRDSLETLRRMNDIVEQVRACQLIVSFVARPPKIEPLEPEMSVPKTEGPWEPLPNPLAARNIVDEILRFVAQQEDLNDQVELLSRLVGSRLMCDPEIHGLFRTAVREFAGLSEGVKSPALKLLENPESDTIRASLNMPPQKRKKVADPALDDWTSPLGPLAVDVAEIDPGAISALNDQQTLLASGFIAQSYLFASRYRDATVVLRHAFERAVRQANPVDRIRNLLSIAEQQVNAGAVAEARRTLREIGLPTSGEKVDAGSTDDVFTEARLSDIARLQIVGRYFDDALRTIDHIGSESVRDGDYAFLAVELIRIGRWEDAEKTIARMSEGRGADELGHRLALARGEETEEHYAAVGIPFPADLVDDRALQRCCNLLLRKGLFDLAGTVARRIEEPTLRSNVFARIVREYMLLFVAYRDAGEFQQTVRGEMLDRALRLTEDIPEPAIRTNALQRVAADALTDARSLGGRDALLRQVDLAMEGCSRLDVSDSAKAELMARLIRSKILLELPEETPTDRWPLIDRKRHPQQYEAIRKRIDEALEWVNHAEDDPQRGRALSLLAEAAGQIGRPVSASVLIKEAEASVMELSKPTQAVDVLLSLIPTLRKLDDSATMRSVYQTAFSMASDMFLANESGSDDPMFDWRVRDAELDRIVRSRIEYDFLNESVETAGRIREAVIRDRLLQAIAYIRLDRKEFEIAESIARNIENDEIRMPTLRDVLFLKRQKSAAKPTPRVGGASELPLDE